MILEKSAYFRESYSSFNRNFFLLTTHALHLTGLSPLYIGHHCNSIRKLTMAQELPKHVFTFKSFVLFIKTLSVTKKSLLQHTFFNERLRLSIQCPQLWRKIAQKVLHLANKMIADSTTCLFVFLQSLCARWIAVTSGKKYLEY